MFDALCWFYQDCRILAITIWYLFLTIFSKNLCLLFHDFTVFYIPMTNHIHFCNLKDHNIRNFRRPFSVFLMIREIPCAYQTSSLYKSIEQMYSYKLIISLSNSSIELFHRFWFTSCIHMLNHFFTEFKWRFMIFHRIQAKIYKEKFAIWKTYMFIL